MICPATWSVILSTVCICWICLAETKCVCLESFLATWCETFCTDRSCGSGYAVRCVCCILSPSHKQGGYNNSMIHLQLGLSTDSSLFPPFTSQSSKSRASFCYVLITLHSILTDFERVLPRYVNLSTIESLWPFTGIFGSVDGVLGI